MSNNTRHNASNTHWDRSTEAVLVDSLEDLDLNPRQERGRHNKRHTKAKSNEERDLRRRRN